MSTTAAPTKAAVAKQVGRASAKVNKGNIVIIQSAPGGGRRRGPAVVQGQRQPRAQVAQRQTVQRQGQGRQVPQVPVSGLKISFKPSELGRTTDKNVSMQIKAVLGKSGGAGGAGGGRVQQVQQVQGGQGNGFAQGGQGQGQGQGRRNKAGRR
ncbi:hypothetical protein B484DRAFT_441194 [Ochromonadaceae sp. CCMP2298]|nr:hypothetical protein B484DRAFT_441194 [Ochromonadaceae sp. CCMP2298]